MDVFVCDSLDEEEKYALPREINRRFSFETFFGLTWTILKEKYLTFNSEFFEVSLI
jgi:hypothetical protein